jgi:hypothetical protein
MIVGQFDHLVFEGNGLPILPVPKVVAALDAHALTGGAR